MSVPSTLYRFRIELTDIDRHVYESLDFRVALHPSESLPYLLTRVLAYCLNYEPGLEFSKEGLGDPEGPTLFTTGVNGVSLWIEIGNPSVRKLHKASKGSNRVRVYTYKDPQIFLRETQVGEIHRAERIEIFALEPDFLETLASGLGRDVRWNVIQHDRLLTVSQGEVDAQIELKQYSFL